MSRAWSCQPILAAIPNLRDVRQAEPPHLPPAHTPPPQARAEQEDEDEERLRWFVSQLQLDIVSPWFFLDVQALLMTIPTAKQVLWH